MQKGGALWWQNVFDERYTFTHEGSRPPEAEIQLLKTALGSSKKVLDVACGEGRLAIPLAKTGYSVVGVDYSHYQIDRAKKYTRHAEVSNKVTFLQGDMRALTFHQEFDAAIIMFSSFGYFADEEDHQRVLQGVAEALIPGGVFVLDTINPLPRIRAIQEKPKFDYTNPDGVVITQSNTYTPQSHRWRGGWEWSGGGYTTDMRLFTLEELEVLFVRADLKIERVWGTYSMKTFDKETSPRLIIEARK